MDGVKILLVDDESAILDALQILFRGEGFDVSVANSGKAARASSRVSIQGPNPWPGKALRKRLSVPLPWATTTAPASRDFSSGHSASSGGASASCSAGGGGR